MKRLAISFVVAVLSMAVTSAALYAIGIALAYLLSEFPWVWTGLPLVVILGYLWHTVHSCLYEEY